MTFITMASLIGASYAWSGASDLNPDARTLGALRRPSRRGHRRCDASGWPGHRSWSSCVRKPGRLRRQGRWQRVCAACRWITDCSPQRTPVPATRHRTRFSSPAAGTRHQKDKQQAGGGSGPASIRVARGDCPPQRSLPATPSSNESGTHHLVDTTKGSRGGRLRGPPCDVAAQRTVLGPHRRYAPSVSAPNHGGVRHAVRAGSVAPVRGRPAAGGGVWRRGRLVHLAPVWRQQPGRAAARGGALRVQVQVRLRVWLVRLAKATDVAAQRRLELRPSAAQAVHHRPGGAGALLCCSSPNASNADSPLLAAQATRCCFPDSAETSLCLLHADSLTTWAPTGARTICLCVHEYPAC